MPDESISPDKDQTSALIRQTADRCAASRRLVEQSLLLLASSRTLLDDFKTLEARLLVTETLLRVETPY